MGSRWSETITFCFSQEASSLAKRHGLEAGILGLYQSSD